MLNDLLSFLIKDPGLFHLFFLSQPDCRRLIPDGKKPSLKINDSSTALWFMNIVFCQHFFQLIRIIERCKKKLFHIKSIDHIGQFMLISEKSCGDLADLDTFSRLPEKLHGKGSVFLTGSVRICLKKFCGRLFNF